MVQPVPWNVRGIDPDVREAALLAARRAGMTLGQWLNAVIGDTVSADGLPQMAVGESMPLSGHDADPLASVTRRIRAFNERGSSAALAAAGATRQGDDVARVGEIVGSAIENMARSASERDARTIAALEAMTDLLRRQATEAPGRRAGDAASTEAGQQGANPVRQMIERIETRLDNLGTDTQAGNVEASLRELDNRLAEIARKLEQPSRIVVEPVRDDNIERIEGKLGAILDTLNLKTLHDLAREAEGAAEPAPETAAVEAPSAEIAVEAPVAEAPALAGEEPPVSARAPIPAAHIRSVVDDIARRQHALDAEDDDFAELTAPDGAAPLADLTVSGGSAPLADLQRRIEKLSARFDQGDNGASAARIEALHTEIAGLSRAIENVAPRHVVVSIEEAIRDLAARVEQSRDGGVRAAQLAPVEALLNDLRAGVESLRDSRSIDTLRDDLRAFANALERNAPDNKGLEAVQLQIAELRRSVVDAHEPEALQGLEHRIISLADKLDRLVMTPREAGASAGLTSAVEAVRSSLQEALPTDLIARLDQIAARIEQGPGRADFDALQARMDQMQSALLERPEPASAGTDLGAIEGLLRNLSEKIDATQRPGGEAEQLSSLASQVSRLNERFENAPGSAVLDKALQDLFGQLDTVRQNAVAAAESAARELVSQQPAGGAALDSISRDMTTLRQAQRETDHRTQLTLTAVNEALGKIVARLGQLETGGRSQPAPAPVEPVKPQLPPAEAPAMPELPRASADDFAASVADRASPLDMPIEPGTGRPGSSSARPATSLGGEPASDSKADFIAAARRAARAAEEQSANAIQAHRDAATGKSSRFAGTRSALAARRKPIMLAIIAALVGIAALQAVHFVKSRQATPEAAVSTSQHGEATTPSSTVKTSALPETIAPADPVTVGSIATQPPVAQAPAQAMPAAPDQLQAVKPMLAALDSARLRDAALAGEPGALYEAAARYIDGKGVEADPAAGAKLLEAAAQLGSAPSQYRLGALYREGKGVTADKTKAYEWFRRAAEAGHARAMHNAGVLMAEGVDGAPDYGAAADWFRRASDLNVRDSQYNLAILYARGLGVKQDLAASYQWFNAAATQGDADAGKKRDEIAGRMQPGELAAAKAATAAWKAKPLDPRANEVTTPDGGWDAPVKTGAAKQKGGKA